MDSSYYCIEYKDQYLSYSVTSELQIKFNITNEIEQTFQSYYYANAVLRSIKEGYKNDLEYLGVDWHKIKLKEV